MTIDKQTLNEILIGKTHSIKRQEGDVGHLYFKNATTAFLKRGDEGAMRGDWEYSANGFNVGWQGGPSREWILDLDGGELSFSLEGVGLMGVSSDWKDGDVEALEAEFDKGAA